jgi:prepilin-type N-terminal cleavage/methylation domain-containing protein
VKSSRKRRAGFTLVEVLLTLLIMGGIMAALSQILTAARTSRDTIHNVLETQGAGPAILDLLERDLRGIVTYDSTRMNHLRIKNRVIFGFDADNIDFVSSSDSMLLRPYGNRIVRSDINEVGYCLRPAPGNDQFLEIYRREGFGVDEEPFEGGEYQLLHDRVKGMEIQIFTEDGPDAEPLSEWGSGSQDENIGLPARIEITLTLELAPRITNEQLRIAPLDRRTLAYRRVIRLPEGQRQPEEQLVLPAIPAPPTNTGSGLQAGANGQPQASVGGSGGSSSGGGGSGSGGGGGGGGGGAGSGSGGGGGSGGPQ